MPGPLRGSFRADQLEIAQGRHGDGPEAAVVDPDGGPVPGEPDFRGPVAPLDALDHEMVEPPAHRMAPFDLELPALLIGLEDLLDGLGVLVVGGLEPALEDLREGPLRVLGMKPVDRDLHLRPDDGELEGEAGELLGQLEDLADVEDGRVLAARLELSLGREDELAGALPFGRAVDRRRELEEAGRRRPGLGDVVDEQDPYAGPPGDDPGGERADVPVPLLLHGGRRLLLPRLAGLEAGDAKSQKEQRDDPFHGPPSPSIRFRDRSHGIPGDACGQMVSAGPR